MAADEGPRARLRQVSQGFGRILRLVPGEPRPGFAKATVNAWRVSLDERGLGSSSIIVRMSAIRKLAVEATDNGLLTPELAAGIARVKSAKSALSRRRSNMPNRRPTGYSLSRAMCPLPSQASRWMPALRMLADFRYGYYGHVQRQALRY